MSKFITNFDLSYLFAVYFLLYIHNLNITLEAKILKLKLSDILDMKNTVSPYEKCFPDWWNVAKRNPTSSLERESRSLAARVFQFASNGSVARKIRDCRDLLRAVRLLASSDGFRINLDFNFSSKPNQVRIYCARSRYRYIISHIQKLMITHIFFIRIKLFSCTAALVISIKYKLNVLYLKKNKLKTISLKINIYFYNIIIHI